MSHANNEKTTDKATAWTNDTVCWGLDHGASAEGLVEQMTREEMAEGPADWNEWHT